MKKMSSEDEVDHLKIKLAEAQREISRLSAAAAGPEQADTLFEIIKFGYWEWDFNSEHPFVGSDFAAILGCKPEEVAGEHWQDRIFPEDLPAVLERFEEHLSSGGQVPFEAKVRFRHKKGHTLQVWAHGKVARWNRNGSPAFMIGSVADFTEFSSWQKTHRDSSQRLRLITEGSQAGIWEWDLHTGQIWWSERFLQLIGYKPGEIEPNLDNFMEMLHPDDRDFVQQKLERSIENPVAYKMDFRLKKKDGTYSWFEGSGKAAHQDGKAYWLAGSMVSIDERKRLQLELQEQIKLFKVAEETARLGSSELDFRTGEIRWSEQVYKIHEVDLNEKPDLQAILKAYEPGSKKIFEKAVEDLRTRAQAFDIQVQKRLQPNQLTWMRIKAMPVLDEKGEVVKMRSVVQDINDMKLQEQQLREQDLLLSEASRIAHIGAWRYEIKTRKSTWSEEAYRIHEVPFEYEVKNSIEFYHGNSKEAIRKGLAETIETGRSFSLEAEIITGKARRKWVKIKANAMKDEQGRIYELRGFIQDIDERKNRELELQRVQKKLVSQNRLLREAEQVAKIGAWEYDIDNKNLTTSAELERIIAVESPGLEQAFAVVDQPYRERLQDVFEKAMHEGEVYEMQVPITTGDNSRKWMMARGVYDGEDHKVRGIFMDITELKEKKNELRRYNRQLEKQQSLLKQAEQMAQLSYWEWDEQKQKLQWSDQHRAILEVPENYEMDLNEAVTEFYKKKDIKKVENYLSKALTDGKDFIFDAQINTYTGNEKWIRVHGAPRYVGKNIVGVFGTVQDIDIQKKREIEIEETARIVAEQNKRLLDFTHIVSHNLRSHSSNLQTMLKFLAAAKDDPNEMDTCVEFISETANSLHETLNYLNEALQVQTQTGLKKKRIKFQDSLKDALNVLKGEITLTGARIRPQLKVTEIKFVKPYLDSILLNLISNSLKYRHPERKPEVEVRTYSFEDGRIVLEVQDNGLGINLERNKDKLFGLYKTFHHNSEARGVGLFITKQQVVSQGGEIEVESKEGNGSVFRVIF